MHANGSSSHKRSFRWSVPLKMIRDDKTRLKVPRTTAVSLVTTVIYGRVEFIANSQEGNGRVHYQFLCGLLA